MKNWIATVLAPLISATVTVLKRRVPVTHGGKKGLILLDQVRTVDKARLAKRLGAVSAKALATTLGTLQEVFAE